MSVRQRLLDLEVAMRGAKQRLRDTRLNDVVERTVQTFSYDDVFLVSFPKSGNTWSRFLLTGMYMWFEREGRTEPNYYNIHRYIPDLHIDRVTSTDRLVPGLPRLLKSHRGYTPNYHRVVYVVRDVRDTLISRFHFINRKRVVFPDFDAFIRHPRFGAEAWARHVRSWLDSPTTQQGRMVLIRYEDLHTSPANELRRIGEFMNVRLSDECIAWMIQMSDKRRVRKLEDTLGRPRPAPVPFMRKGTSGQWREELTSEQLDFVHRVARAEMERCGYVAEPASGIAIGPSRGAA